MTFEELINIVVEDVDENVSDTVMLKKIRGFINRGYKVLAKKEKLEKTKTYTLTENRFKKPYDFCDIVEVTDSNRDRVNYMLQGSYIIVKEDIEEVILTYNYLPDNLEDEADETLTNEANVEFIVDYAKYLYYMSESLIDEAKMFKNNIDTFNFITKTNTARIVKIEDIYGVGDN